MSGADMKGVKEYFVDTRAGRARIWEKGRGKRVGFFAGLGGLPRWTPFLDALAQTHRVIAPSLPGYPGGPSAEGLDEPLDRILAAGDVFDAAGLDGADLVGASVGGALAAEIAAIWPGAINRLVLIAPFGLFDSQAPMADVFAQRPGKTPELVSANPAAYARFLAAPEGVDAGEWEVMTLHANIAAANMLWPLGDTWLSRRLDRITAPTLVLWGEADRVMSPGYAQHFTRGIGKHARSRIIARAGHTVEIDQPGATARAVSAFLR